MIYRADLPDCRFNGGITPGLDWSGQAGSKNWKRQLLMPCDPGLETKRNQSLQTHKCRICRPRARCRHVSAG